MSSPKQPSQQRSEPSIGRFDDITDAIEQQPQKAGKSPLRKTPPASRKSYRPLFILLAFFVVASGIYAAVHYQDRLRTILMPNTELNDIITRANKALSAGKLIGTQGDSARELFEKAKTLDEDNDAARQGLNQIGEQLIQQADAALSKKDLVTVKQLVDSAREIVAGGSQIGRIETALRKAETQNALIEDLLKNADTAFAAGKLMGEKSARIYYQRMLDADPANAIALAGQKKIADTIAKQAREAIDASNQEIAEQRIAELTRIAPNHSSIPELRGAVAQIRSNAAAELEQWLTQAEAQLRAGVFTGANDSAQILFQNVLKSDPANKQAKAGLHKVAQALIVQATAALEENNVNQARELLSQAEKLGSNIPELQAAKSQLREVQEQIDIAQEQKTLTGEETVRIRKLLAAAEKAVHAGNFSTPPGESAYDYYREVLRIEPNNPQALEGLKRIEKK